MDTKMNKKPRTENNEYFWESNPLQSARTENSHEDLAKTYTYKEQTSEQSYNSVRIENNKTTSP